MPNNNLPPGWGNRDSSAKPDWGNSNKEPVKQENETAQDSDISKSTENASILKEEVQENPKTEFTVDSTYISDDKKIKKESIKDTPISEQPVVAVQGNLSKFTEKKKSKAPVIILGILLIIVVIALVVLVFLYFHKNQSDSKDNAFQAEVTTTSTTASTTKMSTETTTTSATIETTTTEITTTTEMYADVSSYIGFWHKESVGYERELTISSVKRNTIIFSLWYYRIDSIEDVPATLEDNTAYFDTGDVQGYLTFEDDIITVVITSSSRSYMPSEIMTFDGRHEHSWEYEGFDTAAVFEPYIIEVTNPKLSIYDAPTYDANIVGEITDNSRYTIVEEYCDPFDSPAYFTWGKLKSGLGWVNLHDATMPDDPFYDGISADGIGNDEDTPNVWCPNCGYGFFTTGVGTEGFTCPSCGHNWLP